MITARDENYEIRKFENAIRGLKYDPKIGKKVEFDYASDELVKLALKASTVAIKQNQKLHVNQLKIIEGINEILKATGSDYRIVLDKPKRIEEKKPTQDSAEKSSE